MEVLLSIVLPVYNVAKYLDDCMKTIIGKNEDLVEILLIDDGSTDDSGKIADLYASCNKNVKTYHKKMVDYLMLEIMACSGQRENMFSF